MMIDWNAVAAISSVVSTLIAATGFVWMVTHNHHR